MPRPPGGARFDRPPNKAQQDRADRSYPHHAQEDRISGYMVTTHEKSGSRNLYMVNASEAAAACASVNQMMRREDAQALSPIPAETIAQHKLRPGQAWLCTTLNENGEVTHSELK